MYFVQHLMTVRTIESLTLFNSRNGQQQQQQKTVHKNRNEFNSYMNSNELISICYSTFNFPQKRKNKYVIVKTDGTIIQMEKELQFSSVCLFFSPFTNEWKRTKKKSFIAANDKEN